MAEEQTRDDLPMDEELGFEEPLADVAADAYEDAVAPAAGAAAGSEAYEPAAEVATSYGEPGVDATTAYEPEVDPTAGYGESTADATTGYNAPLADEDWAAEPEYETGDETEITTYADDEQPADEEQGGQALSRATAAAREARRSFASGIEAFRDVHEASHRHSAARGDLKALRKTHADNVDELEHRLEIEQNYPEIVTEQTAELEEATALFEQAGASAEEHDAQKAALELELENLKKAHEEALRPYRNVAESTKGRADDAARALADGRRALKAAEGALSDAKRQREQRIANANGAVDSASARLRRMEGELSAEQARENTSPEAINKLQNELVSVRAHLDAARAEVPVETEKGRLAVEEAQQRVFDLQAQLQQLESDAEASKREATERRAEYDNLLKRCQDEQRALSDQIKQHGSDADQARKTQQEANDRIEVARTLLDEAEEIHGTPQLTIDLKNLVAQEQLDIDTLEGTVNSLAEDERELRRSTFKQRLLIIVAALVVIAIVVAIILAILGGGK